MSADARGYMRGRRTFSVLVLEDLIHVFKLFLPFPHQLFLPLLAFLDPSQGVVYVAVRITQRRTFQLRIELSPVSHPIWIVQ